ncbi:BTB/POZ protein [Phyllosticta citriasiana]|uniref:BTB/POZ protein n=1 Tax=Phyllosticta citriasiana TaxID=595635 RepID=A0ABR1KIX0_9PEZI
MAPFVYRTNINSRQERMLCLWEDGMHSDVTIRTLSKEYRLHKAILCEKSEFFFKALNGGWKESKESVIEMTHDDPETVEAMLKFMYLGEYDVHEHGEPLAEQLADHAAIHAAAIKYNVAGLAENAARNFDYVFGYGSEEEQVRAVVATIPFLCETIPPSVSSEIAADVAKFVAENLEVFLGDHAFNDVMAKHGSFSMEVFARIHAKQREERQNVVYACTWGQQEQPAAGQNDW